MEWHLILMIIWSLIYILWKIFLYSTSMTTTYSKPSTGIKCDFYRWKERMTRSVKGYFHWYGTKHLKTILLAWLIYGGFFIW